MFKQDRSLGTFLRKAKNYLSESRIQRSQLYTFLRNRAHETLRARHVGHELSGHDDPRGKEALYNELLDLLVRDFDGRGIDVVFFGVTGHLAPFPDIVANVQALADEGLLSYLRSEPWFEGESDYATPEGHAWGAKAHRIVAEHATPALKAILETRERAESPHRPPAPDLVAAAAGGIAPPPQRC